MQWRSVCWPACADFPQCVLAVTTRSSYVTMCCSDWEADMANHPPPDRAPIETSRLELSPADPNDGQETYDLLTHPDMEHVHRLPPSAEAMAKDLEHNETQSGAEDVRWSARRKDDGRLVATARTEVTQAVDLVPNGPPEPKNEVEVTMYVHPDLQGSGYGREVYEGLLEHLGEELGLDRVVFRVHHTNEDAQAVVEALGARNTHVSSPEGHEKWHLELD